jgi:hypothetical protein
MDSRLRALTLGAFIGLTFGSPGWAATPATPRATPSPRPIVADPRLDAGSLYSPHAKRLVQAYLRLRLLELREEDLDRVRAVIEGKLRVDDLLEK